MRPEQVSGRRFNVLGAAESGVAAAALLQRHGARVFVSERQPGEKMAEAKNTLDSLGIASEFGGNSGKITDADVLVISPGVPSDAPAVRAATAAGLRVVSELEVASWFCQGPIVAITGTNGKTTTTTLVGEIFKAAGFPTVVGGNISPAFSEVVGTVTRDTVVVLEVSSFQLDHSATFHPRVSVLLNITPDHLDRYGNSFERYSEAKTRVFLRQGEDDTLIYNADDSECVRQVKAKAPRAVRVLPLSVQRPLTEGGLVEQGRLVTVVDGQRQDIVGVEEVGIPGLHNRYNTLAAALAAVALGVPTGIIRETVKKFSGVEHRLEFVRDVGGVRYVNDSKATNVDSVWYALQSFNAPIVLMLGGRDKGNDYARLYDLVRKHVRAIVAIGESADKVTKAFEGRLPLRQAKTMEEAVHMCAEIAVRGDVVLLSPACASFDWFKNYMHRGNIFKEIVGALPQ